MDQTVPLTSVSLEQLKVSGCFPPVPSQVQIANITRGQISAREQLFQQAALVTAGVKHGRSFT